MNMLRFLIFALIIGYGGYLAGVKSENVYGQTYGKISYQSTAGGIDRGIDQPAHIKYNSTFKSEFVTPAERKFETTAQLVGVQRAEDTYKKVRALTEISIYIAHPSRHSVLILRS
jgi:hypothetical protein